MNNSKKMTVTRLPQTEGNVFCVRYDGIINAADYEDTCVRIGNKIIEEHGRLRMLIEFSDDFKGWEDDAAVINLRTIFYQSQHTDKLAYINPTERTLIKARMILPPHLQNAMKVFAKGHLDDAVRWIKSDDPA